METTSLGLFKYDLNAVQPPPSRLSCAAGQAAPDGMAPVIQLVKHHFTKTANVLVG